MSNFNFDKFLTELHNEHKEDFSKNEIREILNLEEAFSKDNPMSIGKSLILRNIAFKGEKDNGDKIDFYQEINEGINIWFADNNKGKSSILKIIKYALTGVNSLKKNIKSWIDEILLNFNIGNKDYSIYLNTEGRLKAKFFNVKILNLKEYAEVSKEPIFEVRSDTDFKEKMEKFFFNQFSYYSLKWTQKSSVKDSNELLESGTSWKTYFKSIYLESKDYYDLMYGSQGTKVFQMLLGLEFTYPINKLKVDRDFINDKKGKAKLILDSNSRKQSKNKKELEKQLVDVEKKLKEDKEQKVSTSDVDITDLNKRYDSLNKDYKILWEQNILLDKGIKLLQKEQQRINNSRDAKNEELRLIKLHNAKNSKRILELKEHIEIGIFFSNLDIKHCPSCNHSVTEQKKKLKLEAHKCALCDEAISDTNNEDLDINDYKQKIIELEHKNNEDSLKKQELQTMLVELQQNFKNIYNKIIVAEQKKSTLSINSKNINQISNEIKGVKNLIDKELSKKPKDNSVREKLIAKKAVIEFQLNEIEKESSPQNLLDTFDKKIKLLNSAIEKFIKIRYDIGVNTLNRLQDIMLNEIQEFGLKSITEIKINSNFEIKYKQNGEFITFNDITEGEQLRAKIAFYLSLIQLDIEFNVGRHTRFLMIDSPSKEEGDKKYLEGLSEVLRSIQDRFGNQLQILIGTAERGLINTVKNEFITPEETFVF